MVQKGRDEGATKLIFEKLHEYSLFPFETRAPLFCYGDRALPGLHVHYSKRLGNGTAHCQLTSGVTEKGNTHCIKAKMRWWTQV